MRGSADTIAAVATPPGRGAIAIVRISGPQAVGIARAITSAAPIDRRAILCRFNDAHGVGVDQGLMLYFRAPRSFTGEDVVELHGHGGILVSETLLAAVLRQGARLAQPGEFALRAFLNDKLDLAQAEAIADLIDSGSEAAARAALRSLEGVFSQQVLALQSALTALRVQIEAWLDFPDEELEPEAVDALIERFEGLDASLMGLADVAQQGAVLRNGLSIVIAGPPNAGKSSLMNRLAGYDAAIVTPIAGTTRDTVKEHISLDGLPINVVDTAGLRESADPIESEGIRRSHAAAARADRLLWVVDIAADLETTMAEIRQRFPAGPAATVVQNKVDLIAAAPAAFETGGHEVVRLSALTGEGVPLLVGHLKKIAGFAGEAGGTLSARTRHVDALQRAGAAIDAAHRRFVDDRALELAAEELRGAQTALGEITGEISSDELLGEVFASFCIGK